MSAKVMNDSSEARIYLSGQRGYSGLDWFRSLHTFNFGTYQAEGRMPFGVLQVLNDDTLAAEATLGMHVEQGTEVMIIPLSGGLQYRLADGRKGFASPGEILHLSTQSGSYEITNPYPDTLINFLQVWIKNPKAEERMGIEQIDLREMNTFLPLQKPANASNYRAFIGKYDGRMQSEYQITQLGASVFVFVIEGAFEVQDRLLESRDGLSLKHGRKVEFEALSSHALLLVIEIED
ncbi:pirin family protein [Siphonobacter sp. SORGH_AS_1065]|uniref:pirin family protein n=1 Tax=Siphonobacter sp. SORGH_AS_1065 TaxID=3041795 RepID=UPI0027805346|nr:pirin family protein [Siphonobacter sp. SORGH_AS_1065]MDQ1087727.1 redox-sensitive bicupin YhaK (pirin superfamily) [Siphonobacter sp. SORGH_AS_1065]